jgi:hypothetical protein
MEWGDGSFRGARLLIAAGLGDPETGPTTTALGLLAVRNMIRAIRPLLPAEGFEVIKNPIAAAPLSLRKLWGGSVSILILIFHGTNGASREDGRVWGLCEISVNPLASPGSARR